MNENDLQRWQFLSSFMSSSEQDIISLFDYTSIFLYFFLVFFQILLQKF